MSFMAMAVDYKYSMNYLGTYFVIYFFKIYNLYQYYILKKEIKNKFFDSSYNTCSCN